MNNILLKVTVGILVVLGIAGAFLWVSYTDISPSGMRMADQEANWAGRAIENGALIYEANCVGCHGVQGQGIPGVAPALNTAAFFTTRVQEVGYTGSLRSYIESTVNAGRPVGSGQYSVKMPTWGQTYGGPLRPDQIRDVASYILNWEARATGAEGAGGEVAATPTPAVVSGDPVEVGKATYSAQGCVGCHGEPGGAGIIGPNLGGIATRAGSTVAGQSAEEYIRTSIVNPSAYIVAQCPTGACASPSAMPATYGQTLSPEQLDGLVQYLLTLE
jgi:mono/diheme cytochrome c family protein